MPAGAHIEQRLMCQPFAARINDSRMHGTALSVSVISIMAAISEQLLSLIFCWTLNIFTAVKPADSLQ